MKRVSNVVAASLGIILYVALVLFAELQVVHIDDFASYEAAIAFTAMSFLALTFVVLLQAATGMFKIQWYLPIVVMTAVYLVMVDAIIFFAIGRVSKEVFILMHIGTILLYYIIIAPMILAGRKRED